MFVCQQAGWAAVGQYLRTFVEVLLTISACVASSTVDICIRAILRSFLKAKIVLVLNTV